MDPNFQRDFQICISVPLISLCGSITQFRYVVATFSFIWWKFYLTSLRNCDLFNFIVCHFCLNSLGEALRISLCGGFI